MSDDPTNKLDPMTIVKRVLAAAFGAAMLTILLRGVLGWDWPIPFAISGIVLYFGVPFLQGMGRSQSAKVLSVPLSEERTAEPERVEVEKRSEETVPTARVAPPSPGQSPPRVSKGPDKSPGSTEQAKPGISGKEATEKPAKIVGKTVPPAPQGEPGGPPNKEAASEKRRAEQVKPGPPAGSNQPQGGHAARQSEGAGRTQEELPKKYLHIKSVDEKKKKG